MRKAALLASLVLSLPVAAQNLVTNGSFEVGAFNPAGQQTQSVNVGSTAITGWIISTDAVSWIGAGNPWGLTASSGGQFLDLTDAQFGAPFAVMQQTIATVPGTSYRLTFDLGSSSVYGLPVGIRASAGSTTQDFSTNLSGTNIWTTMTLDFVATSTSTVISLAGIAGQNYTGLDNVSVVSTVPEAPSSLLMTAGVAIVGIALRQRRRFNGQ